MTTNICANCQYYRDRLWCSNSKSPDFMRQDIRPDHTCKAFARKGKAPLSLRLVNKLLAKISKELDGSK